MSSKLARCLAVMAFALPLAGQVALAEEMDLNQARAECSKPKLRCKSKIGEDFHQCLVHNGRIAHACNILGELERRKDRCGSPRCQPDKRRDRPD